jgi:hypothetical protein
MMSDSNSGRFTLHRIDDRGWVIRDTDGTTRGDAVAELTLTDEDLINVRWCRPVPLPVIFAAAEDVVESLQMWAKGRTGPTKPIPIPHLPPPPESPVTRHRDGDEMT